MPDTTMVMAGIAVLAVAAMSVALAVAWLAGRRRAEALLGAPPSTPADRPSPAAPSRRDDDPRRDGDAWQPDPLLVDRVVRIVALLFIAAAGTAIAVTGSWLDRQVELYLLLAAATLFVVFAQDLLPDRLDRTARSWIQVAGAVAFLTVLVGLTEGLQSPFFVGYFLLVGGVALGASGSGPILLALASATAYASIGLLVETRSLPLPTVAAWIGFNVLVLLLLAYVGTVAARAQGRAREAALRLSRYDALTGLFNRGAFFSAMEREIRRAERSGRIFSLVMLDLDDLKPVNDTFGHPAGDRLLGAVTEVIMRTIRATDTAGRYGGDEFVVLLPETDAEGAFVVAEKLRRDVGQLAIRVQDRTVRTSVSLGLVAYPDDGTTMEALLSAVDAAMYEAKRRGKNQIVGYTTRTERVATAIGPEPPAPPARDRASRAEASRAAEIGRPPGIDDPLDAAAPAYPAADAGPEPVPTMPSLPSRPVPPTAASAPAVRVITPVRPQDAATAGRPPVPPPGSARWNRGRTTRPPAAPRDPRRPVEREYIALPIDRDPTER